MWAAKCMLHNVLELQGEKGKCSIMAGDAHPMLLSVTDRSSRHRVSTDMGGLSSTVNQLDLFDSYGTVHPQTAACTFSSSSPGRLAKKLGPKAMNKARTGLL